MDANSFVSGVVAQSPRLWVDDGHRLHPTFYWDDENGPARVTWDVACPSPWGGSQIATVEDLKVAPPPPEVSLCSGGESCEVRRALKMSQAHFTLAHYVPGRFCPPWPILWKAGPGPEMCLDIRFRPQPHVPRYVVTRWTGTSRDGEWVEMPTSSTGPPRLSVSVPYRLGTDKPDLVQTCFLRRLPLMESDVDGGSAFAEVWTCPPSNCPACSL